MSATDKQLKDAFNAIEKAASGGERSYFKQGRGVATLKDILHTNGAKGETYVFEFDINEVTQVGDITPNKLGPVAYIQKPTYKFFYDNMAKIMAALTGVTFADLEESAKNSEYKAAQVKAGVLGPAAPWSVAQEFMAFVADKIQDRSLTGRRVKFAAKQSESREEFANVRFYAIND